MLKSILSKDDCASCKFCCSFRRQSLWETPLFEKSIKESLEKRYPSARFKMVGNSRFTVDLLHLYKTKNPEEEASCPFLEKNGCVLNQDEKPFDCSIWPLRICRVNEEFHVMLENTCPAINNQPLQNIKNLAESGLGERIIAYAKEHPDSAKEILPGFKIVY